MTNGKSPFLAHCAYILPFQVVLDDDHEWRLIGMDRTRTNPKITYFELVQPRKIKTSNSGSFSKTELQTSSKSPNFKLSLAQHYATVYLCLIDSWRGWQLLLKMRPKAGLSCEASNGYENTKKDFQRLIPDGTTIISNDINIWIPKVLLCFIVEKLMNLNSIVAKYLEDYRYQYVYSLLHKQEAACMNSTTAY